LVLAKELKKMINFSVCGAHNIFLDYCQQRHLSIFNGLATELKSLLCGLVDRGILKKNTANKRMVS
jgi:hypothetical protein